ncbi:BOS complex subunit ncln [Dermacentor variabilis]|uniref:BOS complex subunit ncln n=1 Tax=Dermacentor variabilis TaxID=34621 RepID=UPI003F5C7F2C
MYLDGAEGVFEFLRGNLPFYVIVFVPLLIVISPVTPVLGSHEFTVYRMQHYDLQGTVHGSRSSVVNTEARTLHSSSYHRKVVIARLADLTHGQFNEVIQQGAAGVLIFLPQNFSDVSPDKLKALMELEHALQEDAVPVPVYFAYETDELKDMYKSVQRTSDNGRTTSVAQELWGMLKASGFQLVVLGSQAKVIPDIQLSNIQGKLSGFGVEEQLPTGVIVAHYDAFGISPALSFGADSNGSGVAALLELARLFSRLYTNSRTHPQFNLVFLISAGGKFNYHGTKKWIEDNIDSTEGSLLADSLFTMCLDSLGSGDDLYVHVSKPPKEGSTTSNLFNELQRVSSILSPAMRVSMVHKKINLADETLAWEHERFSMRRLPAFTVSHLPSHRSSSRSSIFDTRDKVEKSTLARNVKVIAEALARILYNVTDNESSLEVFRDSLGLQEDYLSAWVDTLSSEPRGAQLMAKGKAPLVSMLEQGLSRHLKEVRLSAFRPDKRDPEVVFYDTPVAVMNAYSVKPAVFDLFLAALIGAYLGTVYLVIVNFHHIQRVVGLFSQPRAKVN